MKKYLFVLITVLVVLASCKSGQSPEEKLEEKRACYKECMLVENDKEFCLEDCDMEEKDIEEKKEICGDGVCQNKEKEGNLCPADCGCTVNADCETKEICENNACQPVDCTLNSHCPENYECQDNACLRIDTLDEDAVAELQQDVSALKSDIQSLLDDINNLQDSLDAADASDEDRDAVQEDIDALDTVITQLKAYYSTLNGYADDLESATKNSEVADVGNAFNITKEKVDAYLVLHQAEVDDIEEAIAALVPAEKPDLIVDDVDFEDVDGQTGTFTVTVKNDDDGNITTAQTFRIQLTSYDLENDAHDDSRETITSGLGPNEEIDVEMTVELPYDIEEYFEDNANATSLVLQFLVEVDIDGSINESDETNNNQTYNVTFDRDDYITNTAPVASLVTNTTSILARESIFFNASASTDSDGTIAGYSWNFGDGDSSTVAEKEHTYTTAGTYTVTLTVTDNDGATDTETVIVTVA